MSIQNFQTEIQNTLEHANLDRDLGSDANINYSTLHDIIQKVKLKHMTVKLVEFVKHKHKNITMDYSRNPKVYSI